MAIPVGAVTVADAARGSGLVRWVALAGGLLAGAPVLVSLIVLGLFAGTPEASCQTSVPGDTLAGDPTPSGLPSTLGRLAEEAGSLAMREGESYEVGSTYYFAGDATGTGTRGAIPDPEQSDLTRHPNTFAELSSRTVNDKITFRSADALGRLPWMTAVRVTRGARSVVVYKRDIGFGQGAKTIAGRRYRIDLWGPAAKALGVTSGVVKVQLAPKSGAGNVLGDTPDAAVLNAAGTAGQAAACEAPGVGLGGTGPLALTRGERAKLLANGLAAAPEDAPDEVKRIVAAGNEIVGKPYRLGGGHGLPLSYVAPAYDCSSSVSHLLGAAGLMSHTMVSGLMATSLGRPGYGKWVSVLANAGHVYVYVAGLRWDTHRWRADDRGVAGIGWHTAARPDTGFAPRGFSLL